MTPRERWLAVLRREAPDRVPMDYWGTPETSAILRRRLGCRTIREALTRLHVDFVVKAVPEYVGPRLKRLTDVAPEIKIAPSHDAAVIQALPRAPESL